jgi:hypothetical protein
MSAYIRRPPPPPPPPPPQKTPTHSDTSIQKISSSSLSICCLLAFLLPAPTEPQPMLKILLGIDVRHLPLWLLPSSFHIACTTCTVLARAKPLESRPLLKILLEIGKK